MKIPIDSFSQAEQVFDPLQEADCKSFCSWMRMRLRRRAQRSGWRDVHGRGQKEVFCLTAYKECSDIRSMMRFLHHQFKCSRQLKKNKMTTQTMHLLCWIQTWLCPLVSLLLLNLHCRGVLRMFADLYWFHHQQRTSQRLMHVYEGNFCLIHKLSLTLPPELTQDTVCRGR